MSAYYDQYDYTSYWEGRDYEHGSEVIAIKAFLTKIKKVDRALEIGGGFGRLVPSYAYRAKTAILTEPSAKLLSIAKKKLRHFKNIKFIQSTLDNLTKKVKKDSIDLVLMVRVMHHMTNPDKTFEVIDKLTESGGYLILEFANKIHFKKVIKHLAKRDFGFINDEATIDVRSAKSKRLKTIPFLNYHPKLIQKELEKHNFKIIEIRSVSNIRSPFFKRHLQKGVLLELERYLQKPLSYIYFGPSIFILAKKKG